MMTASHRRRSDGPLESGGLLSGRRRTTLLALAAFAFFTVDGLVRFGYFYLGDLAMSRGEPARRVLMDELTGSYAAAILLTAVVLFALRGRIRRSNWIRRVPLYAGILLAYSGLKTTLMWGSRSALSPILGLGPYDYGEMTLRYPMEFLADARSFVVVVGAVHVWLFYRDARDRELRTARLEARLADARLAGLHGQLRPHFLFNTLNTVSSVMRRSTEAADRMLSRLSDLLRWSMADPERQEVSLDEELDAVELYLDILEARFGNRLRVEIEVNADARNAAVPRFLLQPLVENAVKHGLERAADAGWIRIAAERTAEQTQERLLLTRREGLRGQRGGLPAEACGSGALPRGP